MVKLLSDVEHPSKRPIASPELLSRSLDRIPAFLDILDVLRPYTDNEIYVAGGALRNVYLSSSINDVDFFMSSSLLAMLLRDKLLKHGKLNIGPLGSPRWYPNRDDTYFDFVAIESVDHGFGPSKNIEDVLARFDFTANAIAFQPLTGQLLDPFFGQKDIANRIMRAVRFDFSNNQIAQNTRLTWRAALWLRLVHYSNVLKLRVEPMTKAWIAANSDCAVFADEFSKKFFVPNLNFKG